MYSEQIELVVQYKTTTQSGVEIAESTATILLIGQSSMQHMVSDFA